MKNNRFPLPCRQDSNHVSTKKKKLPSTLLVLALDLQYQTLKIAEKHGNCSTQALASASIFKYLRQQHLASGDPSQGGKFVTKTCDQPEPGSFFPCFLWGGRMKDPGNESFVTSSCCCSILKKETFC